MSHYPTKHPSFQYEKGSLKRCYNQIFNRLTCYNQWYFSSNQLQSSKLNFFQGIFPNKHFCKKLTIQESILHMLYLTCILYHWLECPFLVEGYGWQKIMKIVDKLSIGQCIIQCFDNNYFPKQQIMWIQHKILVVQ